MHAIILLTQSQIFSLRMNVDMARQLFLRKTGNEKEIL